MGLLIKGAGERGSDIFRIFFFGGGGGGKKKGVRSIFQGGADTLEGTMASYSTQMFHASSAKCHFCKP